MGPYCPSCLLMGHKFILEALEVLMGPHEVAIHKAISVQVASHCPRQEITGPQHMGIHCPPLHLDMLYEPSDPFVILG